MPNTPAQEDYLKAAWHLGQGGVRVTTSALAEHLGVSKPSVTAMVKRLADEGYLDYSPRQGVRLAEKGLVPTMRVVRRHRLLELFLVEVLGFDWSEVHEEADVLEHHLSDRMVAAMDRVLGHPTEDPHGHPIPDANAALDRRDLTPLGDLGTGEHGTVREVRTDVSERLRRWAELGLVPGAAVRVTERQDLEDVLHLEVDERSLVTGSEGVDGVYVERVG